MKIFEIHAITVILALSDIHCLFKLIYVMIQVPFKKTIVSISAYMIAFSCFAQSNFVQEINSINTPNVALASLRFLASDELMGRGTARPEINIAARYISEEFRSMGLKECPETTDYFQNFDIKMITPATAGTLTVSNQSYNIGADILQIKGEDMQVSALIVYAGFGSKKDLDKLDVKGKIVVTNMGSNDSSGLVEALGLVKTKQKLIRERGGIALIERFKPGEILWDEVKQHFTNEHPEREEMGNFEVFLINDTLGSLSALIQNQSLNATITITGSQSKTVLARNVIGWVEGTDAKLKNQFLVLSAHYDHLGMAKESKMEEGKKDSIYNGARDNAIGATAVIAAARYFAEHPSKRSILFIAYTAEEIGLIGSKYFAAHPPFPLHQLVYNLNIDNASYNDTTIITVTGLGRTSADEDIKRACSAYGLTAMPDPAPEENLFDRSDNVSLAVKGIPAPTFSLGIRKFDENINKRYHQLSDEVGNLDLSYAMKYINSFVLAAKYIADNTKQPMWVNGDKYEEAWKNLYKK
jgi:hypothetical protein